MQIKRSCYTNLQLRGMWESSFTEWPSPPPLSPFPGRLLWESLTVQLEKELRYMSKLVILKLTLLVSSTCQWSEAMKPCLLQVKQRTRTGFQARCRIHKKWFMFGWREECNFWRNLHFYYDIHSPHDKKWKLRRQYSCVIKADTHTHIYICVCVYMHACTKDGF